MKGIKARITAAMLMFLYLALHNAVASGQTFVLFSNKTHINRLEPNSALPIPVIYNLMHAIALDVDVAEGHVYWTDVKEKTIKRANIDGSKITDVITSNIGICDGIAVEWVTRRLYWTDTTYDFIQVANLDGSNRQTIIDSGLDQPRGIAVYPQANMMFWTDWGANPKIERASLDGQSRIALITVNIIYPNEITIDYSTNQIYWADGKFGWLQTADLDGKSRDTIYVQEEPNVLEPFGVSILGDTIYWTDWMSKGIHKINKKTKKLEGNIYNVGLEPVGVTVYDSSRQLPVPSSFMLVTDADAPAVYKIYTHLPNHNRMIVSVNETTDITYEPFDQRLYWIDGSQRNIRRVFLNMSGEEVFASYSVRPESLAIDWLGRHLYWTDAGTRRIEAAQLNTRMQTPVIMQGLEKPRGLVLDPPNGHMYWTDWGRKPKIEKANMDGTSRFTLVEDGLHWPNGLTIDYHGSRIYWADAFHDKIESCDLFGANRRIEFQSQNIHPFSLAFSDGYVYWSDVRSQSVQKLNTTTGVSVPYVKHLSRPYGVFVYDPASYTKVATLCDNINAGCSHMCLIRHNGYTCACPSGYKLHSDRKTCKRAREFLLITDASAPSLNILPLDGSDSSWTPVSVLPATSTPSDFDYDPIRDTLFWTDLNTGTVNSYNLANEEFKFLHRCNVEKPLGIAVDWINNNIYWTDSEKGRIEVSRPDGSMRKVLVQITNVTGIVLNLEQGKMFVSACGILPKIEVLQMDGTSRMIVVNRGIVCPTSLTLDHHLRRIYWLDATRGVVESVYFNGANREVFYFEHGVYPQGFTLDMPYAFLTDQHRGNVYKINIHNNFNATMVTGMKKPTTIRYFNTTSLTNVFTPCSSNNSGCSDLCLYSAANVFKCACAEGKILMTNKKSCDYGSRRTNGESKRTLLIADMDYQDIFEVALDTSGLSCDSIYDSQVSKSTMHRATKATPASITYNPSDQLLYWTDVEQRAVMRGSKDGLFSEIIVKSGLEYPDGIDVDYISENVYWTDSVNKKIEVSKLDGSNRKLLISWSLKTPGSIVVDPIEGNMYWTVYSSTAKIETSHMDGSNRKILIGTNIKRVTGLAIDFKFRKLYWVDGGAGKIECISLSGQNRLIVYDTLQERAKRAPFGLAFNRGKLYWADVLTRSVYQLEIAIGTTPKAIITGLSRPVDVRVVGPMDIDIDTNQCSVRNGDCSNLCLPLPAPPGRKCACPDGVALEDEDPTTCVGVNRCSKITQLLNGKVGLGCRNIPGGVCNVSCDKGYKLVGEPIMRCLDNGSWTARLPSCKVITCFPPLKPKYGFFDLDVCNDGFKPVQYGVTCQYRCNTSYGFIQEGPESTTCQSNGLWTMSIVPASCKDNLPPFLKNCPDNMVTKTDPGLPTSLVHWKVPVPEDNVDMKPRLVVNPSGIRPPHRFPAGKTYVVYTAIDNSGLRRSCSFSVEVRDEEAPKVIECQKNFTFMKRNKISRVFYPGIKFADNVGVTKVDFSNGSNVAWGNHQVTVRAYDAAENTADCKINVLVYSDKCKIHMPLNGFKSCQFWRNGGIYCSIGCKNGYSFTQELQQHYFCAPAERRWVNLRSFADGVARFPDCSRIVGFTELSIMGHLSYKTEKCLEPAILQGIENKISQLLKKYMTSSLSACVKRGSCMVASIKILCNSKRAKRETFKHDLTVNFGIRVYLTKEASTEDINATRNEIKALIKHGINVSSLSMIIGSYHLRLDTEQGLVIDNIKGICGEGQVYWNEKCVNCPVGYYHNVSQDNCEMCPVDSYQDKEGQVDCMKCKEGLSTLGLQSARTINQCRECVDIPDNGVDQCEQWKEKGECDNDRPTMFRLCPMSCGFCSTTIVQSNPKLSKKQRGVNLKAVIPALVVPTVIVVSVVLLVVILLRRKQRRRSNKCTLALDMMLKRKAAIDQPRGESYKYGAPVQRLKVRFEDKKNKNKKTNSTNNTLNPVKKPSIRKDKKIDDEDMYVKIPLKKTKDKKDKKRKKKNDKNSSSEEISEQVSTSLELQEINAQMDATQV
ncbi:low-density lipoprotein receptor-related protein 6-like isoform X2 [Actinia tenebrosa]|uniref:Low-density lipoprotein receptor-related protein 6-like isoform X2 n=1 Tax=Actinia tenebrosa TaxID=6105 RepID=A0A6P8IZ01_ACTTE|nr:low-density lipoprotein receptor-related protein 6-like isoform X2 [Actinia tenebrosa]